MTRVIGLIQARMGSTRLPGKMMQPIAGKPMIGHIVERLSEVTRLSGQVLATTMDPRNDPMCAYVARLGVDIWREEIEDDIAGRLYHAASMMEADAILKINGDCPMIDVSVLNELVALYEAATDADYASNKIKWTYPEGLSAEVISSRALKWCDANLKTDEDREFVANWIRDHTDRFKVVSQEGSRDLSMHSWCVDTAQDLDFARDVFDGLYAQSPLFGLEEILVFLKDSGITEPPPK